MLGAALARVRKEEIWQWDNLNGAGNTNMEYKALEVAALQRVSGKRQHASSWDLLYIKPFTFFMERKKKEYSELRN